jgi:hypothetical protein
MSLSSYSARQTTHLQTGMEMVQESGYRFCVIRGELLNKTNAKQKMEIQSASATVPRFPHIEHR